MAARLHPAPYPAPEIIDLRRLTARDLEPLLAEETATWREELDWDFEKSADLVRRFVDLRALNGAALMEDGEVAGYLYYVLEENKGLIGDLYVRRDFRTWERERSLLETALDTVMASPSVARIESQLMMLRPADDHFPAGACLDRFERCFMRIPLDGAEPGAGESRRPVFIENWADQYQDAAARLICSAYTGHVDSRINDQYRTIHGARRFLHNIVQYPGCGTFFRPASFASFDPSSGALTGVSLASLVAPGCGHITQICVAPGARGTGTGKELLRRSLLTLREMGCRSASLTVTAANTEAIRLYEQMGFDVVRRFYAFVWQGWRRLPSEAV